MRTPLLEPPRWFQEAIDTPFEDHTVSVDGCAIHYLRWGDPASPGLVLVHGGAAHAHWWSFIAPQLTHHYHVLALDLSGHGDSGRRESYPREVWADELMAVAEDARIVGAPILVGHSMGGFVCMTTAA
ncbi:MAG: alpha/beta fold hydrolase, partial [Proteobacteria bacterium]|nr:alpha/beta fold hydrolase [Pseudomonadota bacterium]